jgi:hypothetical protein
MASVTIREYNASTGALIGNVSNLSFGRLVAGSHSPVKVIDFVFTGVSSVSNVKLGLLATGGISVNPSPEGLAADGSASNGRFGIEHSLSFDLSKAAGPATRHFAGVNTSESAADQNNVFIGTRDDVTSQFVYLDIEPATTNLGAGAGTYKVFFDFV